MIEEIVPGNCPKLMTDTKYKISESTMKGKNKQSQTTENQR